MQSTGRPARPYVSLIPLCVGFFLIMMDTAIVNVAIPSIRANLHASLNQMVWVNSIYLLGYVAPLLLAGLLGDWVGRKVMFLAGMALFTAASLWCGMAVSAPMLITARGVEGLGAAAMAPQTMAFITAIFPPDERGTPIGIWAGVGAFAAAVAPVIGGGLIAADGWRWIFFVNVPTGLAGLLFGSRILPGGRARRAGRVDVTGAVLAGLGLPALVFCLQNGQAYHWGRIAGPVTVVEILPAGVALLAAFVIWQHYSVATPLMPLELFRHRNFTVASLAVITVAFALSGIILPLMLFLQTGLRLSPLAAGLLAAPQAVAAGVAGPLAGWLSDRVAPRMLIRCGLVSFAAGITVLALSVNQGVSRWIIVIGLLLNGTGTGLAFSPLVNIATRGVPQQLMGSASGVYNTARQLGSVLGSAVVGALLETQVAVRPTLSQAVHWTLLLPVAVLAGGFAVSLGLTGRRPAERAGGRPAAAPSGTGRELTTNDDALHDLRPQDRAAGIGTRAGNQPDRRGL